MTAKIIGKRVLLSADVIVEGEAGMDSISFEMPSVYNGVDLSGMLCYVAIQRADGTADKIGLDHVVEGQKVLFTLPVSESVTAVAGELFLQVLFENADSTVVFVSERFGLEVKPSIDAYGEHLTRDPNALQRLQKTMLEYVYAMQKLVDEANALFKEGAGFNEENKLSAAYVDGLAAVATSGSYNDLTDKPDLSKYCTAEDLEGLVPGGGSGTVSPLIIKHTTYDDDIDLMIEIFDYNKAAIAEYMERGLSSDVMLYISATKKYVPVNFIIDGDTQTEFYFDGPSGTYISIYTKSSGSYGFSD